MYIEGVFLQGNIKNRNGRMYPMETLRREVGRYNENHIQSGRALGELGHPEGPTETLIVYLIRSSLSKRVDLTSLVKLKSLIHQWVKLHLL